MLLLAEASAAAVAAGIQTYGDYHRRYREVPGLPSNPDQHYPDWPGWPVFLGRATRSGPFLSLPEWCATVRAMGITSSTEYGRRYHELGSLPSNPGRWYPEWPGWRAALENWDQPTRLRPDEMLPFEAAQRVARAAGWRTMREYLAGRREHPGLPVRPPAVYGAQWPGWPAFLGQPDRRRR